MKVSLNRWVKWNCIFCAERQKSTSTAQQVPCDSPERREQPEQSHNTRRQLFLQRKVLQQLTDSNPRTKDRQLVQNLKWRQSRGFRLQGYPERWGKALWFYVALEWKVHDQTQFIIYRVMDHRLQTPKSARTISARNRERTEKVSRKIGEPRVGFYRRPVNSGSSKQKWITDFLGPTIKFHKMYGRNGRHRMFWKKIYGSINFFPWRELCYMIQCFDKRPIRLARVQRLL